MIIIDCVLMSLFEVFHDELVMISLKIFKLKLLQFFYFGLLKFDENIRPKLQFLY